MGAVLPLDLADVHKPQVGLVDERGGLQHMVWTLASHVPLRQAPELVIDEAQELVHGPAVAAPPLLQQRGHVMGPGFGHAASRSNEYQVLDAERGQFYTRHPA